MKKNLIINFIQALEGLKGQCEFGVENGMLTVKNVSYTIPLNAIGNAIGDIAEVEETERKQRQNERKAKADQLRHQADSLDY